MQIKFKFINCYEYDFTDKESGERRQGVTCNCYAPDTKKIVKVKTDRLVNKQFGEEITCNVIFNGRYVIYEAT